jgi:DNA-binding transcriptional regulator YdaS (Cro superfamily)
MSTFHEHVKRAVGLAGNQVKLAELIGISQSEVSRLCTSAKSIPPETAVAIARVTGGQVTLRDMLPEVVAAVESDLRQGACRF